MDEFQRGSPPWGWALRITVIAAWGLACGDPVQELSEQRQRLDESVWADEVLAGEYEGALVSLWDGLLEAGRRGDPSAKVGVLGAVDFESLRVGTPRPVESLAHGIERFGFGPPYQNLSAPEWRSWMQDLSDQGLRLVQSEWHHARFAPAQGEQPALSRVAMSLHLEEQGTGQRWVLEGELDVSWSQRRDAGGDPVPAHVDATGLQMLSRSGPPPFRRILSWSWPAEAPSSRLHPLLVYDLDRDGAPEIVAAGAARVLWNRGEGNFEEAPLLEHPSAIAETAVIADIDGDGHADLLAARERGDLVLYRGSAEGRFPEAPRPVTRFEEPLHGPSTLSVGDVDGDADLDVWLGQYRPAYRGGQMPSPYYDANDGHPSHLLENLGGGRMRGVTRNAGLGERRFRRSYASSLADLDGDTDLDLLVVSDYAGVDLYHNDGAGNFVDANDSLSADRHLFGMSASFADFDLDGRLDFFVAGMASTTARRLEALGLFRSERPEERAMRMRMAFGNRMYLADDTGWSEPDFAEQVARTGWTWGTTAFDFDNDGDADLFAANGHASGESTQDYCTNFWTHDIYDGNSSQDPVLADLFDEIGGGVRSGRESWDGYQKNQLLMNRGGRGFANVAFLLGVADEFDSRSALSADFDLDGRVDLVVVEDRGLDGQRLHVYRNEMPGDPHWIGLRLEEAPGRLSPAGAEVLVRTPTRTYVGRVASGETLMGQHPTILHFGLGDDPRVESIEVRWPGGRRREVSEPKADRYHLLRAPEAARVGS